MERGDDIQLIRRILSGDDWTRVDASVPSGEAFMPMGGHRGTLYIVAADEIFASEDRGETWRTLGPAPKEMPNKCPVHRCLLRCILH